MSTRPTILQRIQKSVKSSLDMAVKYYTILSTLNGLGFTPREIQLLAFMAVRGSISSGGAKEAFIEQFGSSKATIGNMVHKLSGEGYLVRESNGRRKTDRVLLHPQLRLDFSKALLLGITLNNPEEHAEA